MVLLLCQNFFEPLLQPRHGGLQTVTPERGVSHGRYIFFQMAEVAIPRQTFQEILRLIAELRPQAPPAPA